MIKVNRLNATEFVVNCDLIETMEETPDTVITLTTGHRFVVQETVDEIIQRIIHFKLACGQKLLASDSKDQHSR